MTIVEPSEVSFDSWVDMALDLWPECSREDLVETFRKESDAPRYQHYLCVSDEGEFVGFANFSLRSDYVEGSDSSPVGYLEGIYVKPDFREKGIAKMLVEKGVEWAKNCGCTEFASDAAVSNKESYDFHKKIGFEVAGTVVHFIKDI